MYTGFLLHRCDIWRMATVHIVTFTNVNYEVISWQVFRKGLSALYIKSPLEGKASGNF
ncbi:hypothetical protein MNBD_NITROSPINAE04-291 [hydrothermal vent metagenome]|uniref:Uncharacterized protein n=1 Tax=hydrothermal vent metagenome TaxID=652676 RepID=A0A3B1BWX9_9ZZZZ